MDLSELAFFERDGDTLTPTDMALSQWGVGHVHGVAVSGALAFHAEAAVATLGRPDLRPAKHTVDLFKPVLQEPCDFQVTVVRESKRVVLVDVTLTQGDVPAARSAGLWLKATESPDGETWAAADRPAPPPDDVAPPSDQPRVPFLLSDAPWSQTFADHTNAGRKSSWNSAVRVVAGEPLTPYQAVAATADGASLATNYGTRGVQFINSDLTLVLARQPVSTEIGLRALDRIEHDGIAVATVDVFDRAGALGSVVITALANADKAVKPGAREWNDDGTTRDATGGV